MSDTIYIYALLDPSDDKARYVGRTLFPSRRYKQHLGSRDDGPASLWVQSLKKEGFKPEMVFLETLQVVLGPSSHGHHSDVTAAELRWATRLLDEGHPLLNHERHKARLDAEDDDLLKRASERGRELFG